MNPAIRDYHRTEVVREARRFIVRGRVQGVFFRDSTRRTAEALGLAGYAINLANGDVEVFACGDPAAIDRLAVWLETGPPNARVVSVTAEPAAAEAGVGFRIG